MVKCSDSNGSTFKAVGGTTYYLQAMAPCCYVSGTLRVDVAQVPAPVPVTEFYYYPSDPSTFDRIQFYDSSYDPGGVGFRSRVWDFGDRGTGSPPDSGGGGQAHQYANDGDYLVTLTVTTLDDRTASVSHTVQVRTHDVGITKFKVPESASSGQTRQISVGIRNTRYPETVQVTLEVSVPGSYFGPVGILQQYVPVRASNRTTDFSFNYTFTSNDASIGKAVFRATASMYPARDALPADNVAISLPTKVSKLGASEAVGGDLAAPQSGVQLALLGVRPNPARAGGDLLIRLSLPSGGGSAKLQLVDLAGRMVTQREVGSLGAGTHEVRLGWGHKVTPGIYWMRLSQGDKSLTTRVTLR